MAFLPFCVKCISQILIRSVGPVEPMVGVVLHQTGDPATVLGTGTI